MEHEFKTVLSKRRLEIAHERLATARAMLDFEVEKFLITKFDQK